MSAAVPLVSIVTATYNRSNVLRYAIQSALWQTLQNFEMIIVGDACTDDSEQVVASFNDDRLHWINLPENTGSQGLPNNAGIASARGQYIAYLNHDDLWLPTHLELMTRKIEETNGDFVYSICLQRDDSDYQRITGISASGEYEAGLYIVASSMLHRRDVVDAIGGWKDYRTIRFQPDMEFMTRAFESKKTFHPLNDVTVIKVIASAQPNIYKRNSAQVQEQLAARIQSEPDFCYRELLAFTKSFVVDPKPIIKAFPPADDVPPGWVINQLRIARGLSAKKADQPDLANRPALPIHATLLRKLGSVMGNRVRATLRRGLQSLEYQLRENHYSS